MFESEERRIVDRVKDFIKKEDPPGNIYIMLRNERILDVEDYYKMVISGKIDPRDVYVYIRISWLSITTSFHYPFIFLYDDILDAYLSKLGFHYGADVFPATGLKYIAVASRYKKYLSIEVSNLDIVANNTNLPKIVVEVLGDKLVSGGKVLIKDEYDKIYNMFKFQKLFAGYDFDKASGKLGDYYDEGNKSLAKEVARIAIDYYRIFHPYRVCYDMKTWKEVDCWSIKL